METSQLQAYWEDIPVGAENAYRYSTLCVIWQMSERQVRKTLQELSGFDSGDNYILIRSGSKRGFFKTDDPAEIEAYRKECLVKGRSIFAPIRKINRVLAANGEQYAFDNNLRVYRESHNMTQQAVCDLMRETDPAFDKPMLSRMENGLCLPTPRQLMTLASIYACAPSDLIDVNLY